MDPDPSDVILTKEDLVNPALTRLDALCKKLVGVGFVVVSPSEKGWVVTAQPGNRVPLPFCKLFLSTPMGAKHCHVCHVLTTVAACSKGIAEHRCHSGPMIHVASAARGGSHAIAVLSPCLLQAGWREKAWKEVMTRGKEVGVDIKDLRREYRHLPELTAEQQEALRGFLGTAAEIVREIAGRKAVQQELAGLRQRTRAKGGEASLKEEIGAAVKSRRVTALGGKIGDGKARPPIIDLVSELVNDKPHLDFSVADIARAARMTPNYFSSLFCKHVGKGFPHYVRASRIAMAKKHLRDITLSVSEVAFRVGYDDAGYFTRCFKKETGMTPKEWRASV